MGYMNKECGSCGAPASHSGLCNACYLRRRRNGHTGRKRPVYGGDTVSYGAVHRRLERQRGRAAMLQCERCPDPAEEWAYDHACPDEKRELRPSRDQYQYEVPYSVNLDRYIALCRACHRKFDALAVP